MRISNITWITLIKPAPNYIKSIKLKLSWEVAWNRAPTFDFIGTAAQIVFKVLKFAIEFIHSSFDTLKKLAIGLTAG